MHRDYASNFRHKLADSDSLIHMSLLGILSGFSCAAIILTFRYSIDVPSTLWLPDGNPENFEALPPWLHFLLPFSGALILGLLFKHLRPEDCRVGIVHVVHQVHNENGYLPRKNAAVQFLGGAFSIATGQSGGREGPAIHLGAAINSLIGQRLKLPNNSIRILVACGTSAAIAASFDTPIAGVIFAMEVIMLEYTVAGFIPVMLATITGEALTRAIYGSEVLFSIPPLETMSLIELPYVVLMGLVIGCFAALFVSIYKYSLHFSEKPILNRFALAGAITGGLALLVPQIMGLGYDSLNEALANEMTLYLAAALILAKLIATAASAGLGLPIGIIGPNLLIGACIGSVMGNIGAIAFPAAAEHHSFYVLLGMGAMMGAVLNAPLAALMALLELSNNTATIFPGMLAITIATLTHTELFKQRSVHQTALHYMNQTLATDPLSLALQRHSVASRMLRDISATENRLTWQQARELAEGSYQWYVVQLEDLASAVLIHRDAIHPQLLAALAEQPDNRQPYVSLTSLAKHSQPIVDLHIQATLYEALKTMDQHQVDAVYVSGYISGPYPDNGVILRDDIENHYKTPQSL